MAVFKKIIELDENNYTANMALAYYYEINKDRTSALFFNAKASNNSSAAESAHLFNNAYFSLCKQEYEKALESYSKIPNDPNVVIGDVSVFLNEVYGETKNLAFLFAEGYINYKWHSKGVGKRLLKTFIKKSSYINDYDALKKEAQRIIGI